MIVLFGRRLYNLNILCEQELPTIPRLIPSPTPFDDVTPLYAYVCLS